MTALSVRNTLAARPGRASTLSSAFTLVELLTVIAIIGVLATLLMSGLSSAKRKSRQSYCTSNLRQISLSTTMYLDDQEKRPDAIERLVSAKYLPNPKALLCMEDRSGNWGNLVVLPGGSISFPLSSLVADTGDNAPVVTPELPIFYPSSYFTPFKWDDEAWKRLAESGFMAGVATCQLHGIGRQNLENPQLWNFQGLILRAQKDGAVVRRNMYWETPQMAAAPSDADQGKMMTMSPSSGLMTPGLEYPWGLFIDLNTNISNSTP